MFESAIVPRWKDSRICFENVYVSRRPGTRTKTIKPSEGHRQAARLLSVGDHTHDPYHQHNHEETGITSFDDTDAVDDHLEDVVHFDLNIDSITVTLSLWRWWNGKGIVTDAEVRGVRGVVGEENYEMIVACMTLILSRRSPPSHRSNTPGNDSC